LNDDFNRELWIS